MTTSLTNLSPDLEDSLPLSERLGITQLVKSLTNKLAFTAPEVLEEKVRIYIESAWLRGRSAGIEETRIALGSTERPTPSESPQQKEGA